MSDIVNEIGTIATDALNLFMPLLTAADPAAASIATTVSKIVTGALSLEPTAVALVNQVKSGVPVTVDQLAQYEADYQAADLQLQKDIAAAEKTAT